MRLGWPLVWKLAALLLVALVVWGLLHGAADPSDSTNSPWGF